MLRIQSSCLTQSLAYAVKRLYWLRLKNISTDEVKKLLIDQQPDLDFVQMRSRLLRFVEYWQITILN
ncbi:MAG: hypothetical protein V7K50_16475 [Nostoc sp.]|uniref:hypothetical protein n=1 Tax=Nostoc sp. TaxID=1180 RepID=UPI002FF67181